VIERRTVVFPHEQLAGLQHPAWEARGASDGPRLTLIAGVHGCEYSSIAAVTRVMNELDDASLTGSITAVPVVSMESFRQRSPFVVPADGKNLNRCVPRLARGELRGRSRALDLRRADRAGGRRRRPPRR